MTHHFLVDRNRHMLLTVVDAENQADELRQDGRAAAPDLDHVMTAGRARGICFLGQRGFDERAFPERTNHVRLPYFFRLWRLMRMNLLVDLLERVFLPLVGLPHGVTG